MMYSACNLNSQGDNIQPWCTPFTIWNQSVVPCPVLTVASWPTYRFLRKQVRWSGIPLCWRIFHSLLWSHSQWLWLSQWSRCFSEILLLFLWSSRCWQFDIWFLCFSNPSLSIWKFSIHLLLKSSLEKFQHYFTNIWDDYNCVVVWTFFGIAFLWDQNENWPFPVLWLLLSFPNLLVYWVQHFHSIIFQDLE